jgi:hypothetical protein
MCVLLAVVRHGHAKSQYVRSGQVRSRLVLAQPAYLSRNIWRLNVKWNEKLHSWPKSRRIWRKPTFASSSSCQSIIQRSRLCEMFCNNFNLLARRPTLKLEDHPLSATSDCLFSIFATVFMAPSRLLHAEFDCAPCRCGRDAPSTKCLNTATLKSITQNWTSTLTWPRDNKTNFSTFVLQERTCAYYLSSLAIFSLPTNSKHCILC